MNNKKRQRLPRIKPSIRRLIASEAIRYPDKPRDALASDLKDTIERMGEISPKYETLIKMISDARNQETNPLDRPWHLGLAHVGLVGEYKLTSEAIAAIFDVQVWLEKAKDSKLMTGRPEATTSAIMGEFREVRDPSSIPEHSSRAKRIVESGKMNTNIWPLTIREALWISLLYNVKIGSKRLPLIQNPYDLWFAARTYADYEIICGIAKVDFDTSILDIGLIKGGLNGLAEKRMFLFESF